MKKVLACILICVFLCPMVVAASNAVAVKINGEPVEFDVPAQIVEDRTMVPMRKIFETFSAEVAWIPEVQLILAGKGDLMIALQIGSPVMQVTNIMTLEERFIELDVPPVIIGDRTLVPVRAISESLGMKVDWDEVTRTVLITG